MNASKRTSKKDRARDSLEGPPEEIRDRLAGLLPPGALDDALEGLTPEEITGSGGLLTQLAGRVIEAALAGELSEHLGYPPGTAPPGGSAGNMRNGGTPKTVHTDIGSVRIQTPRDRDGSFEPQLVAKRQTRLAGLDDKVLDLYGGGMSTRDIADHLTRLYGTQVGRDTISRITASVLEDIAAWRNRPLDAVYPIVYFDAMRVKVREDRSVQNRACYLAVGVTVDGEREALGIWWQDQEGATFWLGVLNDLKQRGVDDVLIACVDGLQGFPEAINAVFEGAWVQTCIVHQVRNSLKYVGYAERKTVAASLRKIYTAVNEEHAREELDAFDQEWGERFPMITDAWKRDWQHIVPFLALPKALRKAVYTTNTIEAMHRQIRKSIKTRGSFPDEQSATKLIYLAIERAETKWRSVLGWTSARAALKIHFKDRLPD